MFFADTTTYIQKDEEERMKQAKKQNGKKIFPSIIPFLSSEQAFSGHPYRLNNSVIWRHMWFLWFILTPLSHFIPFLKGILLFLLLPSFFQMNEDIKWTHVHFGWIGWIHDFNTSEEETTKMERGHRHTRQRDVRCTWTHMPKSYRKSSNLCDAHFHLCADIWVRKSSFHRSGKSETGKMILGGDGKGLSA